MIAAATLAALVLLARAATSGRCLEAALCALLTVTGTVLWGVSA